MANAGVAAAAGQDAPEAPGRLIGYLLKAFAAPGRGPLPPPPSMQQVYRALVRMGEEKSVPDPLP
jgi:hypothetical protein